MQYPSKIIYFRHGFSAVSGISMDMGVGNAIIVGGTRVDIRPIRTEQDYQTALKAIETVFDAEPGTPQGDRLDILTTLVEAYEAHHISIEAPDPIEMIHYYLDSRGLSRRDLEPFIGSRARVSEILNRRRTLTLEMIRKLHQGLGIPAEVLIQPYHLEQHAA